MLEENVKERKVRNTLLLIIFSLLFILANCFVAEMSENKKNYHAELRKDIDGLKAWYGAKIADLENLATHANKSDLDAYTQEKVNSADALSSKLQKEIMDLDAKIINVEKIAMHSNRTVLDTYTQSESSFADLVSNRLGKKIAELEIRIAIYPCIFKATLPNVDHDGEASIKCSFLDAILYNLEKRMRKISEKEGNNDSK